MLLPSVSVSFEFLSEKPDSAPQCGSQAPLGPITTLTTRLSLGLLRLYLLIIYVVNSFEKLSYSPIIIILKCVVREFWSRVGISYQADKA